MKTIRRRLTRGDRCTQPGGVILRRKDDGEYVAHNFNRAPGSEEPTEFYWGAYTRDYNDACAAYEAKVERAGRYETGGSLIPEADVREELQAEAVAAARNSLDEHGFAVLDMEHVAGGALHDLLGDD